MQSTQNAQNLHDENTTHDIKKNEIIQYRIVHRKDYRCKNKKNAVISRIEIESNDEFDLTTQKNRRKSSFEKFEL